MASRSEIDAAFIGLRCTGVTRFGSNSWGFEFEEHTRLNVFCSWRIVANGRVAYGSSDYCLQSGGFGPIDRKAKGLLDGRVVNVNLGERIADLFLDFECGTRLALINSSSDHEGWSCSTINGTSAIAMGGGELSVWKSDPLPAEAESNRISELIQQLLVGQDSVLINLPFELVNDATRKAAQASVKSYLQHRLNHLIELESVRIEWLSSDDAVTVYLEYRVRQSQLREAATVRYEMF